MVTWFDLVCVECFQMIELIVVVLMSQQCGKFTYGEYGFSLIGCCLYSTIKEGFKNKIVLHNFIEVKCNQAYNPGIFQEVYKILGLPILMTIRSLQWFPLRSTIEAVWARLPIFRLSICYSILMLRTLG